MLITKTQFYAFLKKWNLKPTEAFGYKREKLKELFK